MEELELIGEGGFGVVHKVRDAQGTLWARKTFFPSNLISEDRNLLKKRFEREVRYQGAINHPNVARILLPNLSNDPPYFYMDLAEGTLASELRVDRTLGGRAHQALFDILAGLEEIHSLGFKHRDLKPGNILKIRNPDNTHRYAISDFGLMSTNNPEASVLTESHYQGGTHWYAAPELATDFKRGTSLSDIYSFGAILHDIFDGGPRIPYTEITTGGPLGPVIAKCTKKLPARRYKNTIELRIELNNAINAHLNTITPITDDIATTILKSKETLTFEEWDQVFLALDRNSRTWLLNGPIFDALQDSHINQLANESPELLPLLGEVISHYMARGSFDFGRCDILLPKALSIFARGNIETQSAIALALLQMGTKHNRWVVERAFTNMAGANAPPQLALRMKTEIEIQDLEFERMISHLEWSINYNRNLLHPILCALLPSRPMP